MGATERLAWLALASAAGCDASRSVTGVDAPAADALPADAPADALPRICDHETRADVYAPGLGHTGTAGYRVSLVRSEPGPPVRGNNAWTIEAENAAGPAAQLRLSVYPYMPDHGHGTTVVARVTEPTPGTYRLDPVNLWMRGLWTVRIGLRDATRDVELDHVTFAFCVEQ